MAKFFGRGVLVLVFGAALTGCATSNGGISPTGTLIGAGTGVLVGHLTKSKELGVVAALVGYGAGAAWDARVAEARERERAVAAIAVERARAEALSRGTTTCKKVERWSHGRLVVDREDCESARTHAGYRGDPPPPTSPPTVIYEPTTRTVDPYADPPAVETLPPPPARKISKRR